MTPDILPPKVRRVVWVAAIEQALGAAVDSLEVDTLLNNRFRMKGGNVPKITQAVPIRLAACGTTMLFASTT